MTNPLVLFPARIAIGQFQDGSRTVKVGMTTEFYRALQDVLRRLGGESSDVPNLDQIFHEAITAMPVSTDDIAGAAQEFGQMLAQQPGGFSPEPQAAGDLTAPVAQIPAFGFFGLESPVFQSAAEGSPLPFLPLAVAASPMTITADRRCAIHIADAVDALTYSRAGVDLDVTGVSIIEMNLGDTLTVEYTAAPAITIIPR